MKRFVTSVMLGSFLATPALALVVCRGRAHGLLARSAWHRTEPAPTLTRIGAAAGADDHGAIASEARGAAMPVTFVLLKSPPGQRLLLGIDVAGAFTGAVRYESADCSGTPLVPGGGFLSLAQTVGGTVFLPAHPTSAKIARSVETMDRSNGCISISPRGGCCRMEESKLDGFRAAATTSLAALDTTRAGGAEQIVARLAR